MIAGIEEFANRMKDVTLSWQRVHKVALAYLWSVLAWVGFSPVIAAQAKISLIEKGINASFWTLLLVYGAWCLTSAFLTPPVFSLVRRYPIAKPNGLKRIAGYILGSIPWLITSVCVRWLLLPPWDSVSQQFTARNLQALIGHAYLFANQIWDYLVVVVAAHAYEYFIRARNQELERVELQEALATSELQALKSQLHPHFLFNTLQGISALIDIDRARARAMVLKVSSLLRTVLRYGNSDLISFDQELKFVEDYLALEQMRLGDRLQVRWAIEPDTRVVFVPQLILQPLVENAILHGVASRRGTGWIEIVSRRTDDQLEIQIRNSVGGKRQEGIGVGLQNTKARLKCLYSGEASFSFELRDDRVASAILLLPAFGPQRQAREETLISSPEG